MRERAVQLGAALALAALVAATSMAVTPRTAQAVAGFRDVPPNAFYTAPVQWARDLGVTTGVGGSDRFEPDRAVTRAEAITMLWRTTGSPHAEAYRFADQVPGSFYDPAVKWGRGTGVTTGVGGTDRFEPDRSVTRAEHVTLMYRWSGSPPVQIDPNPPYQAGASVCLTFDDGPSTWTPRVLDVLDRHGAVATFFVIGQSANSRPDLLRRMDASGHAVQNHTMTHPALTRLSVSGIRAELLGADQVVRAAIGKGTTSFRPPGGNTNATVVSTASALGMTQVMWTVDPWDWKRPGASVIASRVLNNVRPGSIILLHDGGGDRSQTVAATDVILAELHRRGYRTTLACG
jgi:peptidoglycan-N-acetylglucosamine deacetylase